MARGRTSPWCTFIPAANRETSSQLKRLPILNLHALTYGCLSPRRVAPGRSRRRTAAMTDLAAHYLEEARRQLRGHKHMGESALSQLRDEDFFVTLDPEANSVAILVKHLAGNMRSRFTDFLT